jgi:hypothetical protein
MNSSGWRASMWNSLQFEACGYPLPLPINPRGVRLPRSRGIELVSVTLTTESLNPACLAELRGRGTFLEGCAEISSRTKGRATKR